jgi:glycosyltransferase involved in cell wall biosynthesis
MAKVSIIIPVYNGEKYLYATVESLLKQTVADLEVIIVNDGSTDETEKVIHDLQQSDDRVKYITKTNTGVSDSRNAGLRIANGEFVVFFDADDIAEAFYLEDRLTFLQANTEYGICGSSLKFINETDQVVYADKYTTAPGEDILEEILMYNPQIAACPSNLMFRKSILTDHGILFNTQLNSSADKYFLCILAKYTKCYSIKRSSLCYRVHTNSMSGKLTDGLLFDKIKYVSLLKSNDRVTAHVRSIFLIKSYYMLTAMAFKLKRYYLFTRFAVLYFMNRLKKA